MQEESAVPGAHENPQRSTQKEVPQGAGRMLMLMGRGDPSSCKDQVLGGNLQTASSMGHTARLDERMTFVTFTVPCARCSWQGSVPWPLHQLCSIPAVLCQGAMCHLSTFLLAVPCVARTATQRAAGQAVPGAAMLHPPWLTGHCFFPLPATAVGRHGTGSAPAP